MTMTMTPQIMTNNRLLTISVVVGLTNLIVASSLTNCQPLNSDAMASMNAAQKLAFKKLLDEAVNETGLNADVLIRLGLENFREKKFTVSGKSSGDVSKPTTTTTTITTKSSSSSSSPSLDNTNLSSLIMGDFLKATKSIADSADTKTPTSGYDESTFESVADKGASVVESTKVDESVQHTQDKHTKTESLQTSSNSASSDTDTPTIEPIGPETTPQPATEDPGFSSQEQDASFEADQAEPSVQKTVTLLTNVATDQQAKDQPVQQPEQVEIADQTFIDNTEPESPRRVHLVSKSKSKVSQDGTSNERHESRTSTSLSGTGNPAFSHSASSFVTRTSKSSASSDKQEASNSRLAAQFVPPFPFGPIQPNHGVRLLMQPMVTPFSSPFWDPNAHRIMMHPYAFPSTQFIVDPSYHRLKQIAHN